LHNQYFSGGSFGGTLLLYSPYISALHKSVHSILLVSRRQMGITPRHGWRPMTQKFSNRAEIHAGHDESRRKGVAVAMP
jgi:hypothetical protein